MDDNIKNELIELAQDFGEIAVDALLKEGMLKDIPILGTIVSFVNIGKSVSDRILLFKLKKFLEGVGDVSDEAIKRFNQEMKEPKSKSRITKLLILHLDNLHSEEKAELLGFTFQVYIEENMALSTFKKFASLINKMNYDDLKKFVLDDGKHDWLYAHDYIANGIGYFEVPQVSTLDDIKFNNDVDQTGMKYGANPWGAEVIRVFGPFFNKP